MPKQKISNLQIIAWVLGIIAIAILIFGIIRELFFKWDEDIGSTSNFIADCSIYNFYLFCSNFNSDYALRHTQFINFGTKYDNISNHKYNWCGRKTKGRITF